MPLALRLRGDVLQGLSPPSGVPPTYDGPCRLLDWRHGARDGMTVDLRLEDTGPAGAHPFRGIGTGRESGQRFVAVVSFPAASVSGGVVVHAGETLLLRWLESDRQGMMVRFLLDDGPDGEQGRNPFFGLSVGPVRGEPLELVAWAQAEDETVVSPSSVRRPTPFHQLNEVRQSNILCRDRKFQDFVVRRLASLVPNAEQRAALAAMRDDPEQFATAVVRATLGVSSRAVMNRDGPEATRARVAWRRVLTMYDDEVFGIRR